MQASLPLRMLTCLMVCAGIGHAPSEAAPLYAFTSDRDGELDIFVVDDGGEVRNVTRASFGDYPDYWGCTLPAWSPDGTQIAFNFNQATLEDNKKDLYLIDVDGTDLTRLTNSPGVDWYPTWSPDGSRIAFASRRDGNSEIYVMNPDGSDQQNLTLSPSRERSPEWSPDGTQIAFESDRTGVAQIYLMAPDGFDVRTIPGHPVSCYDPTWSPDGARLAFQTPTDIRVVELDGTEVARLDPGWCGGGGWAWSPDGRELAFEVFERVGKLDIHAISVETGAVRPLTDRVGFDFGLSWFPGAVVPTHARSTSWGAIKLLVR